MSNPHFLGLTVVLIVFVSLASGCQSPVAQPDQETGTTESSLPKMKFHKPRTFTQAVKRLREMHQILLADGELPPPRTFRILEVIHGEGVSAHSHYYLLGKDGDPDSKEAIGDEHEDDHEEMKEERKTHEIEIPLETEFVDLAKWLPNLAAATDLEEQAWNSVSEISSQLQKITKELFAERGSDEELRKTYAAVATEVDTCLTQLEDLSSSLGGN